MEHIQRVATKWQPNGNTGKGSIVKDSIGEYRVVESSVNGNQENSNNNDESVDNPVDNSSFEYMGGTLGKGVVLLTEAQKNDLLEKMGIDAFNHYVEKLATFIIEKNAKVGNHYKTILKWWEEDKKL